MKADAEMKEQELHGRKRRCRQTKGSCLALLLLARMDPSANFKERGSSGVAAEADRGSSCSSGGRWWKKQFAADRCFSTAVADVDVH